MLHARLRDLTVLDPGVRLRRLPRPSARAHHPRCTARAAMRAASPSSVATCSRHAIHGVDVEPDGGLAVRAAALAVGGDRERRDAHVSAVTPLPNLDCNIRVGDTLSGEAFVAPPSLVGPPRGARAPARRATCARRCAQGAAPARPGARGARAARSRRSTGSSVAVTARRGASTCAAPRTRDLFGQRARRVARRRRRARTRCVARRPRCGGERRRIADGGALPFSFPSHFAHVHARGGFRSVIGQSRPGCGCTTSPHASRAGAA